MEPQRKRIRLEYAPLDIITCVQCQTPNSPVTQMFNVFTSEYEPSRSLSPTVLFPQILVNATDKSWKDTVANKRLGNMKWYANGVDITTSADWTNKYSIVTTEGAADRGTLTVKKDITVGEVISLVFKAEFVDNRTGAVYHVETDPVILSTSVKAQDQFSMRLDCPNIIQYSLFRDPTVLNDYLKSKSITPLLTPAKSDVVYDKTITAEVYRGTKAATSDCTFAFYRVNTSTGALTQVTASDKEVISVSENKLRLDLRCVDYAEYLVVANYGSGQVAQSQFSVQRKVDAFTIEPTNGTAISATDTVRYDQAIVHYNGNVVKYPEAYLNIVWKTDSATKQNITHCTGEKATINLANTGIANTSSDSVDYSNNWLDVYCVASYKTFTKKTV